MRHSDMDCMKYVSQGKLADFTRHSGVSRGFLSARIADLETMISRRRIFWSSSLLFLVVFSNVLILHHGHIYCTMVIGYILHHGHTCAQNVYFPPHASIPVVQYIEYVCKDASFSFI